MNPLNWFCISCGVLLGLLLVVSPGALSQAHCFSMSVGTGWHSGHHHGWPHRYHRGWGHWPHYRHHAWFGVPLYPHYYYGPPSVPSRPSAPPDAAQAHKPPLRHSYQDIAPSLRSFFETDTPMPSPSVQTAATQNPHEQYIVYPIRGRESREAWARAERWYLGDVPGDVPRALKR